MAIKEAFQFVYFPKNSHLKYSSIFQITSFFGLPNEFDDRLQVAPTWKNMVGWPSKEVSTFGLLLRIIPMFVIFVGHLLQAISKTFLNILKLVTEFLPRMFLYMILETKGYNAITFPLVLIVSIWYEAGLRITSPFRAAYNVYQGLAKKGGTFFGIMGAAGSLALSLVLYSILFPLAIEALAVNLPVVFMKIGSFVSTNLPWLANVAQAVVYSPVLQSISHSYVYLATSPAYAQGIAYLGIGVLVVGQGIQSAYNYIRETCWKRRPVRIGSYGSSVASVPYDDVSNFASESPSFSGRVSIDTQKSPIQGAPIRTSPVISDSAGVANVMPVSPPGSRQGSLRLSIGNLAANSMYNTPAPGVEPQENVVHGAGLSGAAP